MEQKEYEFTFILEKLKRADRVFLYTPAGWLYFYDPDDENIVYRGYDDTPWGTSDALLFSFKLDDWELYNYITPDEALELIEERSKESDFSSLENP